MIVKLDGGIVLGMFEFMDLTDFLVAKECPYVTVVTKSYGYELEIPLTVER